MMLLVFQYTKELLLVLLVVLILFGGKENSKLMRGLGQGMKRFKNASKGENSSKDKKDK